MNMAPSPEHDNEPKAPDKSDNKTSEGVELRTGGDFLEDHVSSTRTVDLQVSHTHTYTFNASSVDEQIFLLFIFWWNFSIRINILTSAQISTNHNVARLKTSADQSTDIV